MIFEGADGKLVQSVGFDTPKDAQGSVKYLKGDGGDKEVIEICPSRVLHDCEVSVVLQLTSPHNFDFVARMGKRECKVVCEGLESSHALLLPTSLSAI